jgi:outer membrane protein
MMKKIVKFIMINFILVFWGVIPSFSADVAKIGVIDFQKIAVTSSAGKLVQKKLQAKGSEFSKKLKNMQKEIVDLESKLKTESMVLNQEKRDEKGREYRIKVNDFNQAKKKLQYDLKNLEAKEIKQIQKSVFEIVQKIGKKDGFLLIIEKSNGGVIYNPGSIDITDKVILEYNKISAKSK